MSTLLSSFPVKMAAKKRWILLKNCFFWTLKQLFAIHFFVAICIVCPVAIPEPFAHSRGIRLLATHSLNLFDIKTIWNSNIKNFFNFLGVKIKQVWLLFCFFEQLLTSSEFLHIFVGLLCWNSGQLATEDILADHWSYWLVLSTCMNH